MNNGTTALLAILTLTVVTASTVIANDRQSRQPAGSCGVSKTFDKKSKSCLPRSQLQASQS